MRKGLAMDRPEVSVLVNTFERPWHLRRCLVSLACQTLASKMELVVVDDGSRDETAAVVRGFARSAPFPVKFLTHPHEAFQLCRCRNEGAAASTADRLVFFDGDLVAGRDHIAAHLRHLAPGVVTNSYCVRLEQEVSLRIDENLIRSGEFTKLASRRDLAKLAMMYRKAWFYSLIRHSNKPRCKGGDLGVMRSDLERLNGFDENFRAWGGEDDDFGFRLRNAHMRLKYIMNSTRSYHLWHPPAPSRPDRLRNGENEEYLHRPVRLTRCMNGLRKRTMRDLQVRLCGVPADAAVFQRGLRVHFQWPQLSHGGRADVEVLPFPGEGRFTTSADAQLLVVTQRTANVPPQILKPAHIVLSPAGDIGRAGQIRLRMEDQAGLAQALGWRPSLGRQGQRRAA
jgi:glycosyltransferase involved in cell wall biosynthesis